MKPNHLAVLVAVLAVQALGLAWYSLLASPWMTGWGLDPAAEPEVEPFVVSLVGSILGAYTFSFLLGRLGVRSAVGGARLGLLVGLGLLAPLVVTHALWGGVGGGAIAVDAGNAVVSAVLMASILGAWRSSRNDAGLAAAGGGR